MEYIVISMLTIIVFTYLVSIVANKILATPIHMKSLILCACCALLISLILPRMFIGVAGLSGTFGIIIVFAMISSYFIAYYYDNGIQKAVLEEDITTNLVDFSFAETLPTDPMEEIQVMPDPIPTLPDNKVEVLPETIENVEVVTDIPEKEFFYPMKCEEESLPSPFLAKENTNQESNSEPPLENVVQVPQEQEELTVSIAVEEEEEEIIEEQAKEEQYYYPMKIHEDKEELLVEDTVQIDNEVEVFTSLMDVTEQTNVMEIPEVSPEELYPVSTDLDDLMDFAFALKEQRNFRQALKTFHQALLLYPDSEVAPFLVVEIGTILKNLGSYNEAIQVFIDGRSLPGILNNNILEQEFINNIAYLRVVKNILVENSLEFMPFNLIPESAFKQIDAEFSEWRNQS